MIIKTLAGSENIEKLKEELAILYDSISILADPLRLIVYDNSATELSVQAVLDAHDSAILTESQKVATLSELTKVQIRDYLRSQLISASPNVATIKTNIESAIGNNAQAQQAISNIASLYGFDATTASGYVRCALLAVTILVD